MKDKQNELFIELFIKAKQGDKDAFGQLFNEFYKPIYSYFYIRLHQRDIVIDLVQDVFMKVYSSLEKIEIKKVSPLAYFFAVAKNTLIDYFRKKKDLLVEEEVLLSVPDNKNYIYKEIETKLEFSKIAEELDKLPEIQKECIILRFMDDKSYKEISSLLGKNEDTLRQIVSRGLKTLKKNLNENEKK